MARGALANVFLLGVALAALASAPRAAAQEQCDNVVEIELPYFGPPDVVEECKAGSRSRIVSGLPITREFYHISTSRDRTLRSFSSCVPCSIAISTTTLTHRSLHASVV
jgi:hypothetical protein